MKLKTDEKKLRKEHEKIDILYREFYEDNENRQQHFYKDKLVFDFGFLFQKERR